MPLFHAITEPAPFDAAAAAARLALRLAFFIYKSDCSVLPGPDGTVRLIASQGRSAGAVLGTASLPCTLDAQAILHNFDPEYYPPPQLNRLAA